MMDIDNYMKWLLQMNSSVDSVLKDYKKYWKYHIDGKLYTC